MTKRSSASAIRNMPSAYRCHEAKTVSEPACISRPAARTGFEKGMGNAGVSWDSGVRTSPSAVKAAGLIGAAS